MNSPDLVEETNQIFNLNSNPEFATETESATTTEKETETETDDLNLNPDLNHELVDSTVNTSDTVGTDLTGVSFQKDTSSESVNFSGPDYSTSFCRPRQNESAMGTTVSSWILKIAKTFDIGGVSWRPHIIAVGSFGGILLILFLWTYINNPDVVHACLTGGLRLLWYGFIFFLIISVLILLIHFLYYIAYFFELTVHYFHLTTNPLLNERVRSACCFFSDYVNWLIFYPSIVYFLICFAVLLVFDVCVLLPVLAFLGFLVGFLFSLFGKREDSKSVKNPFDDLLKNPTINSALTTGANRIQESVDQLKGVFNKTPVSTVPSNLLPPFPSIQSMVKSEVKPEVK